MHKDKFIVETYLALQLPPRSPDRELLCRLLDAPAIIEIPIHKLHEVIDVVWDRIGSECGFDFNQMRVLYQTDVDAADNLFEEWRPTIYNWLAENPIHQFSNLPFEKCYFAFKMPVELMGTGDVVSIGTDGTEIAIFQRFDKTLGAITSRGGSLEFQMVRHYTAALIEAINDHKSVIERRHGNIQRQYERGLRKRRRHRKRAAPPAFYTVLMDDTVVTYTATSKSKTESAPGGEGPDWEHRWEVRGHECLRVERGPLPMDSALERRLKTRHYQIYKNEKPSVKVYQKLIDRGIEPKQPDEWMAILTFWKEPYIKGPEDKPLIPSIRKSRKWKFEKGSR
jgi:hypothetical protein